jgi:hypothetical protein
MRKHSLPLHPTARRRLASIPASAQNIYIRAATRQASPSRAIKAMCLECVGFDRSAVANCTAPACPLFHYRPFQSKAKPDLAAPTPVLNGQPSPGST